MVANELGPLVPLVGLGGGVGRIRPGEVEGHVVCVQGDKMVHIYNTLTASLQHTWYADTGSKVQDVATNNKNSDVVILVNGRDIVLADRDKNKMEDCDKIRLEAEANEILSVGGTNYVVFCNGAVEDLQLIRTSPEQVLAGVLVLATRSCLAKMECRRDSEGLLASNLHEDLRLHSSLSK